MLSQSFTVSTKTYRFSVDDADGTCYLLAHRHGNKGTLIVIDPAKVRAVAGMIATLKPGDDVNAKRLYSSIYHMTQKPRPVLPQRVANRSVTVTVAYPPTAAVATAPADRRHTLGLKDSEKHLYKGTVSGHWPSAKQGPKIEGSVWRHIASATK